MNGSLPMVTGTGSTPNGSIDNFHIIEDSLREVRRDLPPGYDEQLPKLSVQPLGGYPRVYALALALVAHTDSELDETRIARFVRAFQEAAPLTIGELWALPTMLRLVLLENLRRLSEKMIWRWEERRRAERWVKSADRRVGEPESAAALTSEPGNRRRRLPILAIRSSSACSSYCATKAARARALEHLEAELTARAPTRAKSSGANRAARPPIR